MSEEVKTQAKTRTPLQEAIENIKEVMRLTSAENQIELKSLRSCINYLTALLPAEEAFAGECFGAGYSHADINSKTIDPDFNTFFQKFKSE